MVGLAYLHLHHQGQLCCAAHPSPLSNETIKAVCKQHLGPRILTSTLPVDSDLIKMDESTEERRSDGQTVPLDVFGEAATQRKE